MIKREDVIIDPKDPRVEGLIGKKVLMGNFFSEMNKEDMSPKCFFRISEKSPMFVDDSGQWYSMIAPIPEPTYQELQAEWLEKNALKIGDSVKVTSLKNSPPRFCGNGTKSSIIGTIRKIIKVVPNQITIDGVDGWEGEEAWYMSYKDLEPAKSKYREFRSAEEFAPFRDMWVRVRHGKAMEKITYYNESMVRGSTSQLLLFTEAFLSVEFEDGTPFGVKE